MPSDSNPKPFLFIESFFGGSHKDFALGLIEHSRHGFDLATLPARSWKWRMRGAAFHFRRQYPHPGGYAGVFATDMISLADLKAFYGRQCPPLVLYFHENQITYPVLSSQERDFHYGFTNLASALAADRVLFNSKFQFDSFFDALPEFVNMMPDSRPYWIIDAIRSKSAICHPGCRLDQSGSGCAKIESPPLIIWNHRWEYDKNPEAFFAALEAVSARGIDFSLAILGQSFKRIPPVFAAAEKRFQKQIRRFGPVRSRADYQGWLSKGAIVVSTAIQENFGISVIEAVAHGCLPLVPHRLSYPEIIPACFHDDFLYRDDEALIDKLCRLLTHYPAYPEKRAALTEIARQFSWKQRIHAFDAELDRLADIGQGQ